MKLFRCPADAGEIREILKTAELSTLLVPVADEALVRTACAQAVKYELRGVLATPEICGFTAPLLKGTGVRPTALIAAMDVMDHQPIGRVNCLKELISRGVCDVDMGVQAGRMLDGEYDDIAKEYAVYGEMLRDAGGSFGVILEIATLSGDMLKRLCETAVKAKADYLRISSGMELLGAVGVGRCSIHNIAELYELCGQDIKIKAGGGWEYAYLEDCQAYLEAGASTVDIGPAAIAQLERIGYGGKEA